MRLPIALLFLAAPAAAETPLAAEEFDALTRGRTFLFAELGEPYGAEEYRPGRRVRWSFLDGACVEGRWYPAGDAICFAYETGGQHHCWHFYANGRLRAEHLDGGPDLVELENSSEPLHCPGPNVGV